MALIGNAYRDGERSLPIMTTERAYAAQQLSAFLKHVGPVEAVWALATALEALMELPAGEDHVAAAEAALGESLAEFEELAADHAGPEPIADGEDAPVVEVASSKAPAKKAGQSS